MNAIQFSDERKQEIIDSLFDEEMLKEEIIESTGEFKPLLWDLDADMEEKFDEFIRAGGNPADFYVHEEGFVYQSCWNCATNDEKSKYLAMRQVMWEEHADTMLDYGCAIGTGVIIASMYCSMATGVDICRPSLNFLRDRRRRFHIPNVQVIDLNVDRIQGKYDLVMCTEVLEHVDEPIELAKLLKSITKPGGVLILSWSFVPMTTHLEKNFYLNTPHPDQLLTEGFGKILVEEVGLEFVKNTWFNNWEWRNPK